MKSEFLIRYTCDICGKEECVNEKDSSPMQEYRLPMRYLTETGREQGLTNQRVDVCRACAKELASNLEKHYDMCSVAWEGVRIAVKEREGNG